MKKFMNGFVKGVYTVLLVSIFAFITYYSISNLVTGNYLSNSKLMIVAIVFYILIILALVLLTKITSKKIFFMIVTGMAILVRIGWLIKVPTAPSSDFNDASCRDTSDAKVTSHFLKERLLSKLALSVRLCLFSSIDYQNIWSKCAYSTDN